MRSGAQGAAPLKVREEVSRKLSRRKLIATLSVALPALGALATGAVMSTTVGSAPSAVYKYDWPQFGMTPDKRANDTLETTLTPANVGQLTSLFTVPLNGDTPDGSPIELSNVTTPTGVKDLVYTQGEHGTVTAWDADTGAIVWSHKFPSATGGGSFNTVPAIDPNRQFIYAATNDSMVHKFQVGDGTEVTGGGWPEPDGGGKNGGSLSIATARDGNTYLY